MAEIDDLTWALETFGSERYRGYQAYTDYYNGRQKLQFATEKFRSVFGHLFKEFAENACGTTVDSFTDRLEVLSFQSSERETTTETITTQVGSTAVPRKKVSLTDPLGEECLTIWKRNRMDKQETEVYREAMRCGDAYTIVWPDKSGFPRIWPQFAKHCAIQYSEDDVAPDTVELGAKWWFDGRDRMWHVNVYYPDAIVKWTSVRVEKGPAGSMPDNSKGYVVKERVANPWGRVPLFHFPNQSYCRPGVSQLRDVVPLQDGLNKSVMDMLVTMEFAAFKQRYAIGLEVETDDDTGEPLDPVTKNYGTDRMLAFPDPDIKVGQFDATDLDQFLRVTDKFWISISRVTGIPLHYFYITTGDFPSGDAMRAAEAKFTGILEDRQNDFGDGWEDVLRFCFAIQGKPVGEEVTIDAVWEPAKQLTESERWDTAVKKKAVGVSRSQILRENGYTENEIMNMLEETDNDSVQNMLMATEQAKQTQGAQQSAKEQNPGLNRNGAPVPNKQGGQ